MPAKLSAITDTVANHAVAIGKQIRVQRKVLGVSATTAAQAAGMSRVTWHRLEKGEPSVTLGAYLSALSVLGLDFKLVSPATDSQVSERNKHGEEGWLPARVALADYPQLKQLAWQVHGVNELTPKEALGVYERNWRHLDLAAIEPHERRLIEALRLAFEYEDRDV